LFIFLIVPLAPLLATYSTVVLPSFSLPRSPLSLSLSLSLSLCLPSVSRLPLSSAFLSRLQKLEASVTFGAVVGKKKKKEEENKKKRKEKAGG
jgi:hypothetical protein